MAYVVVRPRERFEIRESVHTAKGSRARTLANFEHLSDRVLEAARQRATRPFDADAVRASAARAAMSAARRRGQRPLGGAVAPARRDMRRFLDSSRRMAAALESGPPSASSPGDPGDALIDLLGVVAQVAPFTPRRPVEPLRFPPLARLRAARIVGAPN